MDDSMSYAEVMARRNKIMKHAVGIDYDLFESAGIGFDYENMMQRIGYTIEEVAAIQRTVHVGQTPLVELRNLTRLARQLAPPGKGARIVIKDEANNPSGSFKARRAAVSVYHAKRLGYSGVVAATSGNYGAAVASQAAMQGLKCIILQECYDSQMIGQPEILEKQRACEALGAEVIQMTVGPELFYAFLRILEETGYFNASLYTPFGIAGVETIGAEIAQQCLAQYGQAPDAVVITHAGGGNLTGTARGLRKSGASSTRIIAASVDLTGLHMASDRDFNRKSFTTGHTGFGIPFAIAPDRSDVPRNAARALRYMDRYVLVKQGEVFYITEALAALEGLERGPAGNISLAAAFALAQQMDTSQTIVVQETEYTGAGKHPMAQLTFARQNGVSVCFGNPDDEIPGFNIVLPEHPSQIKARDFDLGHARKSYLKQSLRDKDAISQDDLVFLMAELNSDENTVRRYLVQIGKLVR
jgi:cysteine synthase